jgi:lipopolysaccharide biosynthesis regulator YciM
MTSLDAGELLHLGLHASQHDEPGKAIEYLKQCLDLEPQNASATYMLGALYAQIGLYDRAKETLAKAVGLEGTPVTAVFQLGLLHLTSGDVAVAASVWQRLDGLSEDNFLNLFRKGLLALAEDDFAGCVTSLQKGIAANQLNEALNDDMRRLAVSAEAAREQKAKSRAVDDLGETAGRGRQLLGNYRQNRH